LNRLDGRQVFITCCDPETVRLMETGRGFYVEKGTVRQDTEKIGMKAAEQLIKLIEGHKVKLSAPSVVASQLIRGASVAKLEE